MQCGICVSTNKKTKGALTYECVCVLCFIVAMALGERVPGPALPALRTKDLPVLPGGI